MPGPSKVIVLDPDPRASRQIQLGFEREGVPTIATAIPPDLARWEKLATDDVALVVVGGSDGTAVDVVRRVRELLDAAGADIPLVFAGRNVHRGELEEAGADEVMLQPAFLRDVVTVGRIMRGVPYKKRHHVNGNLVETTGVYTLVRALAALGRSAVLTLIRGLRRGEIRFFRGEVTSAQVGLIHGQAALHQLLLWTDARFDFHHEDAIVRRQQIPLDADELFADAERFLEGVRECAGRLSPAMVLDQDVARVQALGAQIPTEVHGVLRMFDGHRVLADVLEDSPYRVFETLRVTQRAVEAGLLRAVEAQRPKSTWRAVLAIEEWLVGSETRDGVVERTASTIESAPISASGVNSGAVTGPVKKDKGGGSSKKKRNKKKRANTPLPMKAVTPGEIDWGALVPRSVGAEVGPLAGVVPSAAAHGEIEVAASRGVPRERLEALDTGKREKIFPTDIGLEPKVVWNDTSVADAAAEAAAQAKAKADADAAAAARAKAEADAKAAADAAAAKAKAEADGAAVRSKVAAEAAAAKAQADAKAKQRADRERDTAKTAAENAATAKAKLDEAAAATAKAKADAEAAATAKAKADAETAKAAADADTKAKLDAARAKADADAAATKSATDAAASKTAADAKAKADAIAAKAEADAAAAARAQADADAAAGKAAADMKAKADAAAAKAEADAAAVARTKADADVRANSDRDAAITAARAIAQAVTASETPAILVAETATTTVTVSDTLTAVTDHATDTAVLTSTETAVVREANGIASAAAANGAVASAVGEAADDREDSGVVRERIATTETAPLSSARPKRAAGGPAVSNEPPIEARGEISERPKRKTEDPDASQPSILINDLASVHAAVSAIASAQVAAPATEDAASASRELDVSTVRADTAAFTADEEAFFKAGAATEPPTRDSHQSFDDLDEGYQPPTFWDRVLGKKPKPGKSPKR